MRRAELIEERAERQESALRQSLDDARESIGQGDWMGAALAFSWAALQSDLIEQQKVYVAQAQVYATLATR